MPSDTTSSQDLEFIFLGTGASSAIPVVPCLTGADRWQDIKCRTCRECIQDEEVEREKQAAGEIGAYEDAKGRTERRKNVRGNISGIVRTRGQDGQWRTILIDCGKTFREAATKYFRLYGVKKLDAVLLTHGHADAIAGMDDLRAFANPTAPGPRIAIPVYLSRATLDSVAAQFPYLVDSSKATGGGEVSQLQFRVFEDPVGMEGDVRAFEVQGVRILPLLVEHGRYFSASSAVAQNGSTSSAPVAVIKAPPTSRPFPCWGFVIDRKIVYISDANFVSNSTWDRIWNDVQCIEPDSRSRQSPHDPSFVPQVISRLRNANDGLLDPAHPPAPSIATTPQANSAVATTSGGSPTSGVQRGGFFGPFAIDPHTKKIPKNQVPVFVVDCLRLPPYISHFGFHQMVHLASLVQAKKTFFVGMAHNWCHAEWTAAGQVIDGTWSDNVEGPAVRMVEEQAIKEGFEEEWRYTKEEWKGYVRPAYDGLKLVIAANGDVEEQ